MGERALAQEALFNIVHTTHPKCKRRLFKSVYAVQRVQGLGKDLVRPELHSPWRYSTRVILLALYTSTEAVNLVMQSRLVSSVMLAYVYSKLLDKFAQNSLSNSNWVRVNKLLLLICSVNPLNLQVQAYRQKS